MSNRYKDIGVHFKIKTPMRKRIYSINVPGRIGYSFAVKGEISCESDAIILAKRKNFFEDPYDADYAIAEDITDSRCDLDAFKNCTFEC